MAHLKRAGHHHLLRMHRPSPHLTVAERMHLMGLFEHLFGKKRSMLGDSDSGNIHTLHKTFQILKQI